MNGTKTGQLDRTISLIGFATAGISGAILGGLGCPTLAGLGSVLGLVAAIVLWIPLLVIWNADYSVLRSKIGHTTASVLVSCVLAVISPSLVFVGYLGLSSSDTNGSVLTVLVLGATAGLVSAVMAGSLTYFLLRNVQQEQ